MGYMGIWMGVVQGGVFGIMEEMGWGEGSTGIAYFEINGIISHSPCHDKNELSPEAPVFPSPSKRSHVTVLLGQGCPGRRPAWWSPGSGSGQNVPKRVAAVLSQLSTRPHQPANHREHRHEQLRRHRDRQHHNKSNAGMGIRSRLRACGARGAAARQPKTRCSQPACPQPV